MQPLPKARETSNRCQKRWKTWNRCQAREHVIVDKRGGGETSQVLKMSGVGEECDGLKYHPGGPDGWMDG